MSGTCSETAIESFSGAGGEHQHKTEFRYSADHPAVLVGEDRGPTPVEFLLHALASCICSGIGNIAAARGVTLPRSSRRIEGDIDLRGILGLSEGRPQRLPAAARALRHRRRRAGRGAREIVEQARARSAVYDVLTSGVPVELTVATALSWPCDAPTR